MRTAQSDYTISVQKYAAGTLTEHGHVAMSGVAIDGLGAISLNDAQTMVQDGRVFIPVTFTGTRSQPFSIDWVATDGTAKAGEDFSLASGAVVRAGTGDETRYVEIPLGPEAAPAGERVFTVDIVMVRDMNVSRRTAVVTLITSPDLLAQ